jgi:exonuclease SbcC
MDEARPHYGSGDGDALLTLRPRVVSYSAEPDEVRSSVGELLSRIRGEMQRIQGRRGELEQQIREEQARLQKAGELERIGDDMASNQRDYQRRLELRELARELLAGAARHLSQRFNRDLRELVGRTLPLFTEGRYEHLQIDDDLTVRAFSTEKRDFMNLEEISSGTQRQIMLAVRLALSEELANKSVRGRQFLFLDEPFAFFDRRRTESSIRVLPELSNVITQIWVVAQEFPQAQRFARVLVCEREHTELSGEAVTE